MLKNALWVTIVATAVSCGKDKSSSNEEINYEYLGVSSEFSTQGSLVITGQLELPAGLTEGSMPDKVIGIPVFAGKVGEGATFQVAEVTEAGGFKLNLNRTNPILAIIESARQDDDTFDRSILAEALGATEEELTDVTDAELSRYAAMLKDQAERGGVNYAIVSVVSDADGDRIKEAKSMQFVGLPTGNTHSNAVPTKHAKGDFGFGKVLLGASDQAVAALEMDGEAFALGEQAIRTLASTSNVLKMVKNQYINCIDGKRCVEVQPFFMWKYDMNDANGSYLDPVDADYSGYGMYVSVSGGGFTFEEICSEENEGKLKLYPPNGVEIDAGDYGVISRSRPFDNSELDPIREESSRSNCNGRATGFYGAGGGSQSHIMINWGTGGSVTGQLPEGFFDLTWKDNNVANFELGSSAPFDADGNPVVFVPVAKITKDSSGKITSVDIKLYMYGSDGYEQITDVTPFMDLVAGFEIETTYYGESNVDERCSALDHEEDGLFTLAFPCKTDRDEDGSNWYWPGSTIPNGAYELTSLALAYEMLGSSYRFDLRLAH